MAFYQKDRNSILTIIVQIKTLIITKAKLRKRKPLIDIVYRVWDRNKQKEYQIIEIMLKQNTVFLILINC